MTEATTSRATRESVTGAIREGRGPSLHVVLMLVLTFGTGMVDAIGYIGLDRVFTGNMTGNVVILGMAFTGTAGLPVLGPLFALVGFMAGAAVAGRVLPARSEGRWLGRMTVILVVESVLIGGAAALLFAVGERPSTVVAVIVTTTLAIGMGMQAATARVLALKDLTTVVVTSTITSLAADSVVGGRRAGGAARRATAVATIIAGAALGAALLHWHLALGIAVAAVLPVTVATVAEIDRHAAG